MRFADKAEADQFLEDYFTPDEGDFDSNLTEYTSGNKAAHRIGAHCIGVDENQDPVLDGFYYVHLRSETNLTKPTAYLVADGIPRPAHKFAEQE